jgi:hypothetical protein
MSKNLSLMGLVADFDQTKQRKVIKTEISYIRRSSERSINLKLQ